MPAYEERLGCLPRETTCGAGAFPAMPESQIIRDRSLWLPRAGKRLLVPHFYRTPVKRQQFNDCASNAAVKTLEITRSVMGLDPVPLSGTDLYRRVNGGADRGSNIEANLRQIHDPGVAPEQLYPPSSWRARPSEQAVQARGLYRVDEFLDFPDFDAMVTAILFYSVPGCFGVRWGWGGHAIVGLDAEPTDRNRPDRDWRILIGNSWGTGYGENGLGYLSENQVAAGISARYGGWAPRTAAFSQ